MDQLLFDFTKELEQITEEDFIKHVSQEIKEIQNTSITLDNVSNIFASKLS